MERQHDKYWHEHNIDCMYEGSHDYNCIDNIIIIGSILVSFASRLRVFQLSCLQR